MRATSHFRGFFRPALGALCMLWALTGCTAEGNPLKGMSEAQAMAAEPAPLLNTYWKLVQMGDGSHVSAYDNQPEPHLVLESGTGRFHGAGGCNRLRGSYSLDGRWLRLPVTTTTRMACVQGRRREQLFISTLAQVSSFAVQGQKLTLTDADAQVLLRFEAVYLR
ncbi:META domain-containing protein [Comamonas sp. Y33R10-2]|uniref:META domain-containing protein n=1 Tax=Comamonas sp. Y33R10-2 TaxID=2853257 RepID=UPI001C5CB2BA|nr:META domain-containing protein [Comamonas sp. Y33R10-2]QXZ08578.1 META domain-containing protein [Comamonas sp. Y33R10-2]